MIDDAKAESQDELAELDDELTEDDKAYFEPGGALEDDSGGSGVGDVSGAPDQAGRQRTVPHGALHAEREEHKKTKQVLADLQDRFTRFDERMRLLTQNSQHKADEAEKVPDPEEDLSGYIKHLEARVEQAEANSNTVTHALNERTARNELEAAYVADARRFISERPDFGDAYRFLVSSRAREHELLGATDPEEVARRVQRDEMVLARDALSEGASPSERLYELAVLRGYQPNGNMQGQEKLRSLQRAQDANRSLSSVSGAAGGVLTSEALAEMSEDEFQEVYERLKREDPKQLQALMM